jgi:hypothetical protein
MAVIVKPHKELQNKIDSTGSLITTAIDEFTEYKNTSCISTEIPTPTTVEQKEYQGLHDSFGRDRQFSSPDECKALDIHHVHVFQGGCNWGDDNVVVAQWDCTSNSYLVYSYFLSARQNHIFCILDFIADNAHDIYEQPELEQINYWIDKAKSFKEQNENIL